MEVNSRTAEAASVECVQSLQRTEGLLAGRLNHGFRPFGLSSATFNVLVVLLDSGGSLSPCEIGEELAVTRGTVTGLIDSLERLGHVRRLPHPKDRRMLVVELTDQGRATLDQLLPDHYQGMGELLACLSDSEKAAFVGLLEKIRGQLICPSQTRSTPAQD